MHLDNVAFNSLPDLAELPAQTNRDDSILTPLPEPPARCEHIVTNRQLLAGSKQQRLAPGIARLLPIFGSVL